MNLELSQRLKNETEHYTNCVLIHPNFLYCVHNNFTFMFVIYEC